MKSRRPVQKKRRCVLEKWTRGIHDPARAREKGGESVSRASADRHAITTSFYRRRLAKHLNREEIAVLALEPTDRVLFQTLKQKAWISSSESCLWQGGKHLLTWSVIVSSFPIHTHTQCGPWRQKDLRMFPRHIYLYLQVFVIEWRHLTEVIKPKFGVFDTHASTTSRTKNVPIALFSAASRVAFDKGKWITCESLLLIALEWHWLWIIIHLFITIPV